MIRIKGVWQALLVEQASKEGMKQGRKQGRKEGRLGAGKGFVAHCNAAPGKEFVTWIRLVAHYTAAAYGSVGGFSKEKSFFSSFAKSLHLCISLSLCIDKTKSV